MAADGGNPAETERLVQQVCVNHHGGGASKGGQLTDATILPA